MRLERWNLRQFHKAEGRRAVQPYLLADIGEGITECHIIKWSVKPGDIVEQFDPICEVQSDKATVEITSRFDGTITSLLYAEGEVAPVGQPFLMIDVPEDVQEYACLSDSTPQQPQETGNVQAESDVLVDEALTVSPHPKLSEEGDQRSLDPVLVTPAIRHMLKEADISVEEVKGTGKDGRITKEDVQRHISALKGRSITERPETPKSLDDQILPLSPTESAMFTSMSESLKIPHFLFTHSVDFTGLNKLRAEFNASTNEFPDNSINKLTPLSFIMKAVSQALQQFPKLNSHLITTTDASKPNLIMKAEHDFGFAVDTPKGLLVPVVRGVEKRSVQSLAAEIKRIVSSAQEGRLSRDHLQGATFIISNIGSLGGDVVAPVILPPMVGILALGRIRKMPVFQKDRQGNDEIVKQEQMTLCWSADHRVIDGATVARIAKVVRNLIQDLEQMRQEI